MTRESIREMQAALYGARAEWYASILDVVPPAELEEWLEVESFDETRREIDAPCGYCWRHLELHRVMIRSRDRFGVFWIGQCECETIHFALAAGPVDVTLDRDDSGEEW
ncbi:hypothetical protein [Paludisphaera rhizosphaerae]|uniref:hypothetical protein n=1 Tax=Paludisphaera rhizosphaerae TaxID=2711216 RepID=UPI0013ECF85B|nr:hypothetical protein [Paludisphaera rhizosphaerae]